MTERFITLTPREVRSVLSGSSVSILRPIAIDDTPISEADAMACAHQRGIPTHAQNVRMCGFYVKCDAPNGSATVSSRVDCPFGHFGDALKAREDFAEYEPDDIQGTRTYYRADYPDGRCQVSPGFWLEWTPGDAMPTELARLTLTIESVGLARDPQSGAWSWDIRVRLTGGAL